MKLSEVVNILQWGCLMAVFSDSGSGFHFFTRIVCFFLSLISTFSANHATLHSNPLTLHNLGNGCQHAGDELMRRFEYEYQTFRQD